MRHHLLPIRSSSRVPAAAHEFSLRSGRAPSPQAPCTPAHSSCRSATRPAYTCALPVSRRHTFVSQRRTPGVHVLTHPAAMLAPVPSVIGNVTATAVHSSRRQPRRPLIWISTPQGSNSILVHRVRRSDLGQLDSPGHCLHRILCRRTFWENKPLRPWLELLVRVVTWVVVAG